MPEATPASTVLPARTRADPVPFLGRTQELELIRQLLVGGPARLLTLTGPAAINPGIGGILKVLESMGRPASASGGVGDAEGKPEESGQ